MHAGTALLSPEASPWNSSKTRKRMPDGRRLRRPRDPRAGALAGLRQARSRARWSSNPVMFVVEIVAALTTILLRPRSAHWRGGHLGFAFQINLWLWFTVLFANFAEAVAEGRGKAQAASLRRTKTETVRQAARATGKMPRTGQVAGAAPEGRRRRAGRGGRLIPSDGESSKAWRRSTRPRSPANRAPVIRESGGDRSAVTGGTRVHLRLDQGADHGGAGLDLPRPHDRAGRRRRAAEDAERDRAQHPARRA